MAGQVGNEDGEVGFQIAPMVDVVFVLLLFFMANAGMQVAERELSVNLPSGGPGMQAGPPPVPIIVEIAENGQVTMNNQSLDTPTSSDLPQFRASLREIVSAGDGKDPVIIRPHERSVHDRVVDVLSACSAAGVKKLTFG